MEIDKKIIRRIIQEEIRKVLLNERIEISSLQDVPPAYDPNIEKDEKVLLTLDMKEKPYVDFEKEKTNFNNWWRSLRTNTRWLLEKWIGKNLKQPIDTDDLLEKVSSAVAASKGLDPNSPKNPNEKPK